MSAHCFYLIDFQPFRIGFVRGLAAVAAAVALRRWRGVSASHRVRAARLRISDTSAADLRGRGTILHVPDIVIRQLTCRFFPWRHQWRHNRAHRNEQCEICQPFPFSFFSLRARLRCAFDFGFGLYASSTASVIASRTFGVSLTGIPPVAWRPQRQRASRHAEP